MREFRIPEKLFKQVIMTLRNTTAKVKIQGEFSKEFIISRGLRQGDILSTQLFNLVLEFVIRKIDINKGGTIFNRLLHLLGYADDVDILSRNLTELKEAFKTFEVESKKVGLIVNEDKTKYMINTRNKVRFRHLDHLEIGNYQFERVSQFKYLGTVIDENSDGSVEIKARIAAGNRCFYSLLGVFKSAVVSRHTKKAIYRTIVRPVVLYGAESWCLTARETERLEVWERKILRKIYGPICDNGEWRIRTNLELKTLYKEPDIVTEIKRARLRWIGHLERMSNERSTKKIYSNKPEGCRQVGRPRLRWIDDVRTDIRRLGVRNWKAKAQDRKGWKKLLSEAKVLHGP